MKLLVLNGPNLNLLGVREPALYGKADYKALVARVKAHAKDKGVKVKIRQSNYEGDLVTAIQKARGRYDGLILNAAAYTHTSVAILDALKGVGLPTVEVHLTDIAQREEFRHLSYVSLYTPHLVKGEGIDGYLHAMDILIDLIGQLK